MRIWECWTPTTGTFSGRPTTRCVPLRPSSSSFLRPTNSPPACTFARGDDLIAGRTEPIGLEQTAEHDDRVRFTRLGTNSYGLSVKRHTGRWEKTPFRGTLEETVAVVCAVMQHLVATS